MQTEASSFLLIDLDDNCCFWLNVIINVVVSLLTIRVKHFGFHYMKIVFVIMHIM